MYISLLWVGLHRMSRSFWTAFRSACTSRCLRHPLQLTSKFNDHECRGFSHPDGIARGHGLEQPLVDRFLRKANIKLMRPPVRYIDKRVEILLQQLARIGFQVAPLVVVVKLVVVIAGRVEIELTRPSHFSSADGRLRGNHNTGIRSPGPSAPVAISDNPFHARRCRRWHR
jgi:hypothetical protein